MERIIKQLLIESDYIERTQGIPYYTKEDESFYFIMNITEADFISLKSTNLIDENRQYRSILDGFKAIVNEGNQITIEKNSSLIVLVNCSTIEAVLNLQQQILLFEEDLYFFKKYVILYTDPSIEDLVNNPIIPLLRIKVKDPVLFNRFAQEGYLVELTQYIVILQLFIKLPFLHLDHGAEDFISLNQKLGTALGGESTLHTLFLNYCEDLQRVDFANPEEESQINELLSYFPHD